MGNPGKNDFLLTHYPDMSSFAEAYRTLRTNIGFSTTKKTVRSLVVTSSTASEGKTTTSINLACTMAKAGKRTLLVDADLRKPRLSDILSFKDASGLSELISFGLGDCPSEGKLSDYSLKDLLTLARLKKHSLEITVSDTLNEVSFTCVNGRVADLWWKNRPDSKRLATVLIEKELITREEGELALGHQKKSALRLGDIIHSMGFISNQDLKKELSMQTIEAIKTATSITSGVFRAISLDRDHTLPAIAHEVNIEQMIKEFSGQSNGSGYIDRTVAASVYPTETDNLFVLPSGKIPPNPSEILGSSTAAFLLDHIIPKFDFVILDSPPLMQVSDALLIAPETDGTLLVVRSGNTPKKMFVNTIERFRAADLPLIGIALNDLDIRNEGYYKYYHSYYS